MHMFSERAKYHLFIFLTHFTGVHVFGNENDEDRRRYNRYPGSTQQEVKWTAVSPLTSHNKGDVAPKLIQFMRDVLSTALPDEALFPLREFCVNNFPSDISEAEPDGNVLKLVSDYPLLVLLFKDTALLTNPPQTSQHSEWCR